MGFFDRLKKAVEVGKETLRVGAFEGYLERLRETEYDATKDMLLYPENADWIKVCDDGYFYDANSVVVTDKDHLKYVTLILKIQLKEGAYMLQRSRLFFVVPQDYLCMRLEYVGYICATGQYFNRTVEEKRLSCCKNEENTTLKKLFEVFLPLFQNC